MINLACLHHSFYEVAARVVAAELEAEGRRVALHRGAHAELYPRLAAGELDLMVASWLPHLHAPFYEPVKERLVCIAPCFEDARAFWAVPATIPAVAAAGLDDLARPEVAERMERRIIAPAGAIAVCDRAREVFEAYALGAAGYVFDALEADAAWIAEIRARYDDGRWFVTPLWQPHFLNSVLELRVLDEPRGLMGGRDTGWLVGNRDFVARTDPALLARLKSPRIGLDGVTEMDVLVNVEGLSPEEAAEAWRARRSSSQ